LKLKQTKDALRRANNEISRLRKKVVYYKQLQNGVAQESERLEKLEDGLDEAGSDLSESEIDGAQSDVLSKARKVALREITVVANY